MIPTLESHIYITDTTEGRHLVANPYFHIVDTQGNQLPYISEQDEVYINDREIRLLKLINGEVHYKAQSLQLPAAPLLLENKEKGGYQVDLRPEIGLANLSFNVTHPDLGKREVFADLRFRKAMSVAINREEINEVAFFGLGQPKQFIGFTPRPDFVDEKWESYMIQYDPDMANSLLDEIGMVDKDGDGYRELPNGNKLVINMSFSTQGVAGQVVEMVGQNWDEVGVKTTVKEVTPDEYRSAQSANQLDIGFWRSSQPLAIVLGNNELWVPPFENYFGHRTGMLWAEYLDSDGAKGVKPPDYVYEMISDINEFQTTPIGTPRFKELGERLVKNHTTNLIKIGIALSPAPVYHRNVLKNFVEFATHSYEYYRTYPYRGTQWYLDE